MRTSDLTVDHAPTGITGLDAVTSGGLPRGRATLVAGGPGCGKTVLAAEFLVRGAAMGEAGVLVSFEETAGELAADMAAFGWDLPALERAGQVVVDHVAIDVDPVGPAGEWDLEALFIRLRGAIDAIGARRVAFDTLEVLFAALGGDGGRLRAELRRLFTWLRDQGVTTVVTAERGPGPELTRSGLEEYVADCVIALDHRVVDQLAVRRLRVVKLRGSAHGTSEYPFVIGDGGFSVVPVDSFGLDHQASADVVPTGVADLDGMLGGGGWYRGSVTMFSGASGTGKTSYAAAFVDAACARGQRALYLAFEESAGQLVRNMSSIGVDLGRWQGEGSLRVDASRPTQAGLERHLTTVHRLVEEHAPDVVVLDPITDFTSQGARTDIKALLMRIVDYLQHRQLTTVFTSLRDRDGVEDASVTSLIDNFVHLAHEEVGGRRERTVYIQKARGMPHSHRVRPFTMSADGIRIAEAADW